MWNTIPCVFRILQYTVKPLTMCLQNVLTFKKTENTLPFHVNFYCLCSRKSWLLTQTSYHFSAIVYCFYSRKCWPMTQAGVSQLGWPWCTRTSAVTGQPSSQLLCMCTVLLCRAFWVCNTPDCPLGNVQIPLTFWAELTHIIYDWRVDICMGGGRDFVWDLNKLISACLLKLPVKLPNVCPYFSENLIFESAHDELGLNEIGSPPTLDSQGLDSSSFTSISSFASLPFVTFLSIVLLPYWCLLALFPINLFKQHHYPKL